MSQQIITVTNKNFEQEVLQSSQPVLVDFFADWCGPCQVMGPIVEELAQDPGTGIVIRKADIDQSPDLARAYNVRSIPTLIIFRDGIPQHRIVGVTPKSQIEETINRYAA